MDQALTDEEVDALFDGVERSAFRLETHQVYRSQWEDRALEAIAAGTDPDMSYLDTWIHEVLGGRAAGRTYQRVHIVEGPPLTPYMDFEIRWAYPLTTAAGEVVRIIPAPKGRGFPVWDFWFLDEEKVLKMVYDDEGFRQATVLLDGPWWAPWAGAIQHLAMRCSVPVGEWKPEA
jgi:hypothetical protein